VSALAYGQLTKSRGGGVPVAFGPGGAKENKLLTAIAALIPADVIALHALILSKTTTTNKAGTTTIIDPVPLKWSLVGLMAIAMLLFLAGRGLKDWKKVDLVRLFVPPVAFVSWTGLIGTSALSPWSGALSGGWITLFAGGAAALLVAIHSRLTPS
jgi:hypothetical protein